MDMELLTAESGELVIALKKVFGVMRSYSYVIG